MNSMKIEDQVCSLDLAKRLKELGVKQDSLWYWVDERLGLMTRDGCLMIDNMQILRVVDPYDIFCAAFTVAELGEKLKGKAALPVWTNKDELKELAKLGVPDARAQEMVSQGNAGRYWDDPTQTYKTMRSALKEADARAKTLIEMIEGRRVTFDGKITIRIENEEIFDGKLVVRPANNAEDGKDI